MGENYEADIIDEHEQGDAVAFNLIHDDTTRSYHGVMTNRAFETNDYRNTSELDYSSNSSTTRECGVISSCTIL